jgi:hypothetical protein
MVIVIIGILAVLVVHAAGTSTVTATIAAGAGPTALPPVTTVAATGAAASPSPATWGGAPGAASSWNAKVNTNSVWVGVKPTGLAGPQLPGMPGVPLPAVPSKQFNGFDSVPANTKQLSVNRVPARTLNAGVTGLWGNKL